MRQTAAEMGGKAVVAETGIMDLCQPEIWRPSRRAWASCGFTGGFDCASLSTSPTYRRIPGPCYGSPPASGSPVDLIEPCGFLLDDRRLKRAGLDYAALCRVTRHPSWAAFLAARDPSSRLLLMTTSGDAALRRFGFRADDTILLGRESAGAPPAVHEAAAARIAITLRPPARSLNVALAGAIALAEALRQTDQLPPMSEIAAGFPPNPERGDPRRRLVCRVARPHLRGIRGDRGRISPLNARPRVRAGRFERTPWQRPGGGGGVMSVMRGRVFEKVGVNISTVSGEFSPEFRNDIPGAADRPALLGGRDLARRPYALAAGPGGASEHPAHRHRQGLVRRRQRPHADLSRCASGAGVPRRAAQAPAPATTRTAMQRFKKWCDEYFFLEHRDEARGAGGIFFDYLDSGDWERDFAFVRAVGEAFLEVYPAIVRPRMRLAWTAEERRHQLVRRGRYVEFNLLYDRGTRFGLKTGGNVEAILMSLPPEAAWP